MSWLRRTAARPRPAGPGSAGVALALALLLTGCGSAGQPQAYPEQGVDGLEVPTPTLVAEDWGSDVDNPLWAWPEGETRTYEIDRDGAQVATATVTQDGTEKVEGIRVTWVRTAVDSTRRWEYGDGLTVARGEQVWRDAYAQDLAGNVWWLAHEAGTGGWRAGEGAALAGLVMPARPRTGDAYEHRSVDPLPSAWSRVEDTRATGRTLAVQRDDLLLTSGVGFPSPLAVAPDDAEARRWFAPGLGLVLELRDDLSVELVAGPV
ncbi:MAG: hypothetical protein ACI379_15990 [Nocardioides sp.]|uniref:hypothetical protein n=1 Tax=Nocardioides sp. TaxID=35761 RepID=UPI003F079E67